MEKKIAMSFSGGMDSTSLLLHFLATGHEVHCLCFDYGQRHKREVAKARMICRSLECKGFSVVHRQVDLWDVASLLAGSSLTSDIVVPRGHYAEESMKITVVPNRNSIFLNLVAAYAISNDISTIAYGAHSGDHAIYPDCRPEFVAITENAINSGNYKKISILTPFILLSKGEVLKKGIEACNLLMIDWDLVFSNTQTCYNGKVFACGECGACRERIEAFQNNNVKDPIDYEESNNG